MVFSATFNNISAISWRSVLLEEVTGVPRENHRSAASSQQTLWTIREPAYASFCYHKIVWILGHEQDK